MENTKVQQFITECFTVLDKVHKSISQKRNGFQTVEDFTSGYIRIDGILVNRDVGLRMFTFKNYELFVLGGFLVLTKKVFENVTAPFVQFSFRTLREIGTKKIDILFGNGISEEKRVKFKLENTLSDWLEDKKKYQDFLSLFSQEKALLDRPIISFFESAEQSLRSRGVIELNLLKKIRRQLQYNAGEYIKGLEQSIFLKRSDLDYLETAWSHLLHGNPFHIEAAINLGEGRLKNRSHAILLLTLVNTINRTKNHIDDNILEEEIDSLLRQADSVWNDLVTEWKMERMKTQ